MGMITWPSVRRGALSRTQRQTYTPRSRTHPASRLSQQTERILDDEGASPLEVPAQSEGFPLAGYHGRLEEGVGLVCVDGLATIDRPICLVFALVEEDDVDVIVFFLFYRPQLDDSIPGTV